MRKAIKRKVCFNPINFDDDPQRVSFNPEHFFDDSLVPAPKAPTTPKKKDPGPPLLLSPQEPGISAKRIADRYLTEAKGYRTLIYHNGSFYLYDGTRYGACAWDEVMKRVYDALFESNMPGKKGKPPVPFEVTPRRVKDVVELLKSECHLSEDLHQPTRLPGAEYIPCTGIVAFKNCLLHMPTGKPYEHTPAYFSTSVLPFDYNPDPEAPAPKQWLAFLKSIWPDDPQSVAMLQEWFGYCLSPDLRQHKILLMYGARRAGKGTIGRILRELLGKENVCSPTISGFVQHFGLEDLIGKSLASISDARLDISKNSALAERLLTISGQDPLTVPRKTIRGWHGILPTRLMLTTNELPEIGDASGALPSRFLALKFTRSFEHNENTNLTDDLMRELPGIMLWALEGGRRLQQRGYFIQPESADQVVETLHALSSPVSEYVKDRCELDDPNCFEQKEVVYADWCAWCKPQGIAHGTMPTFGKRLFAALPQLKETRPRIEGVRRQCYAGLKLADQAKIAAEGGDKP